MSLYHYYVVELDLPEVTGTCTINGNPGFATPLTCTDQNTYSTAIKTHKFTDTNLILSESDVYKCVTKVSETTPKLKAGNGVASRATCSITLNDFIGDPNLSSPALVASPGIEDAGTFFGKIKSRNILANKNLRVRYYESNGYTSTLIKTNHYIVTSIKQSKSDVWNVTCKDVLYRADDEKSQFPRIVTGALQSDITSGTTSVSINADIADWTPYNDFTAVIGADLLMITNATGTSSSVTLTVARASTITLGSRTIFNKPEDHSAGDEVFRGRKFIDADLHDVLIKVFEDADLSTFEYESAGIASELNSWLPNMTGSVDAIFYEAEESTTVLDKLCASFMLDIWTDTSIGKITLKATSPWNTTVAKLTEGAEMTYGSISISEPEDIYYSRAFLQYDKRKLTESDDDVNFLRSSLAYDRTLEGDNFYGEEKVSKLGKSIILSNKTSNIEAADLTTVRYAQRFSNRPQKIAFEIEEANLNFKLGDVIEIITSENQDFYGNAKQSVRSQVTQISPSTSVGRKYKVSTITYNPFIGGISGTDLGVNSEFDNNLYTVAGGPVDSGTYTFILDSPYFGQNTVSQAIAVGSFPSGSVVNIVFLNGSVAISKGGAGGSGPFSADGLNGGDTLVGSASVTVNIYLFGTTPDFGNGTYEADGYLRAAGGGGGAGGTESDGSLNLAGGGGGAGNTPGVRGDKYKFGQNGNPGTLTFGGGGGRSDDGYSDAGNGGNPGYGGYDGAGEGFGVGGNAGRAIVNNGGTVNIYSGGQISRFIQGSGNAPATIS